MRALEFTVDIAASPEEVFGVIGDPRSKLAWVPAIKRVEMHAGHIPGPGARYTTVSGVAGLELVFHEEIIQWEPPRRLAYQGESRWGHFRAQWEIGPTPDGSQAHFRMDYWFPGGWLGHLLGSLAVAVFGQRVSHRTALALKKTVEEKKWSPSNG